jgi:hypothetical protein
VGVDDDDDSRTVDSRMVEVGVVELVSEDDKEEEDTDVFLSLKLLPPRLLEVDDGTGTMVDKEVMEVGMLVV